MSIQEILQLAERCRTAGGRVEYQAAAQALRDAVAREGSADLRADVERVAALVDNDPRAATFQTLGQYRADVLRELRSALHRATEAPT